MKNIPKNNRFTVRCSDHQTVLLNRYQRDLDDDESEASANTIKSLIGEIPSNKKCKSNLEKAKQQIEILEKDRADVEERENRINAILKEQETEIIKFASRYIDEGREKDLISIRELVERNQTLRNDFSEYQRNYNIFSILGSNPSHFSLSCSRCMKTHIVTVTPGIIDAIMKSTYGDWVYVDNNWYCRTCAPKRLEMPTLNDVAPLFPR